MAPYLHYLPIVLVLTILLERMRELRTNRQTIPGVRKETLSFKLFLLCGIVVTFGCIAEYGWRGMRPNWPLMLAGGVIVIASFVIRRRAIAALGQFWSMHVEVREGHRFVHEGPFRLVRHPVYLSMLLELFSITLVCGAFLTMTLIPLAFVPILLLRLRLEETALMEKFGQAYQEYRRSTPALFPWKW